MAPNLVMRPILPVILLLVFALACRAEFNLSAHLFDGESASAVVITPLYSSSGVNYTLYTIGGIPSILTASGIPLSDGTAISAVLSEHYTHTLLPSDSDLATFRTDLLAFNASRNAKIDAAQKTYVMGIEDTCMLYTNLKSVPCNTSGTCTTTAVMLCARYEVGSCSPEMISPFLLDYALSINTLKAKVPDAMSISNSITLSNAAAQLAQLKSDLAAIKSAATNISKSKLRFATRTQCPTLDCMGICPAYNFDNTSLDSAVSLADGFASRFTAAPSIDTVSAQIVQSTASRENYAKSAALADVWGPKWSAFKSKYQSLRDNASVVASFNKDSNFTASLSSFLSLWSAMDNRIATRSFDNVDSDYSRIESLVPTITPAVAAGSKPYNDALTAQNHAGDALIAASWRIRPEDKAAVTAYGQLVSRRLALDKTFVPPMTTAQYANLTAAYNALINDAATLGTGPVKGDLIAQAGRAFSQTSVDGVFSLTAALVPMPSATRSQMAPLIPPAVLLLSDLALASVILVVFIGLLLYFKPLFRSRAMLGVWTAMLFVLLFGLGLGSVGLYVVMTQNAQTASFGDFTDVIASSSTTYIALDKSGAPADALTAMSSCAANITGQVKAHWNKTVTIFYISGRNCTFGTASNLTAAQCFDKVVDLPVFVLHYNKTATAPHFSVVYQKQADLWGDAAYYTRCDVGDALN